MYTIVMSYDKSLIKTIVEPIYQREKLVNKLRFLIPLKIDGFDISKFNVVVRYKDQAGIDHAELLTMTEELYKDIRLCYYFPLDTNITKYAGDVEIQLSLTRVDEDTGEQYVMHTDTTTISITESAFSPDSSLDFVDQVMTIFNDKLNEIKEIAAIYDQEKITDLVLNDDLLQVSSNGIAKGSGVKIIIPPINDEEIDGDNDGVLDISNIHIGNSDDDSDKE